MKWNESEFTFFILNSIMKILNNNQDHHVLGCLPTVYSQSQKERKQTVGPDQTESVKEA